MTRNSPQWWSSVVNQVIHSNLVSQPFYHLNSGSYTPRCVGLLNLLDEELLCCYILFSYASDFSYVSSTLLFIIGYARSR